MSVPFKPVTRVALHWPARFVIKAARTTAEGAYHHRQPVVASPVFVHERAEGRTLHQEPRSDGRAESPRR